MNTYIIKEKAIPYDDSWDVIVVGGGPSGCTAAAAAARDGSKTLLIEATGALGGMGTSGLVPGWCPFTDGEKIIYKGLAERVFEEAKVGMIHLTEKQRIGNWCPIDPETLKRVYDNLVLEMGVKLLFNTVLSSVEMEEEGKVTAILVSNKDGLKAHKAKVYIDCTGDGDLAAWAGAEYVKGDEVTGEVQPATHCFVLSNINTYAMQYGPDLFPGRSDESPIWNILKSEKYNKVILDNHLCNKMNGHETVGFNAGHIFDVDNTNAESISEALVTGRKIAKAFRDGLAEFHPTAFANAYLAATAPLIGIRESRRIIGDYVLTTADYFARRSFEDEIARNCYMIDLHNNNEQGKEINSKVDLLNYANKNETFAGTKFKAGESHGISYQCLTPKSLINVLVAGRSISCDRIVQASVRVMPVCLVTGEAAGIAASMAVSLKDNNVHEVNTDELRSKLKKVGAYLP